LQTVSALPGHRHRIVDRALHQTPRERNPIIGARRMILHGGDADRSMLAEAGGDLARGTAEKTLPVDGDRPALDPTNPEREFLEPVGLIETKATGCRRDGEVPVPLCDLHEGVGGIRRGAWPPQRRHHLAGLALCGERAEKDLPRRNAPSPPPRLQNDGPAAHDERERYFGARIRVRDRAAECSAIARL